MNREKEIIPDRVKAIRPHLRPDAALLEQAFIDDALRDNGNVPECEAISVVLVALDGVHRNCAASRRVERAIVDPGARELHLVEAARVVAPLVEEGVRLRFFVDGPYEVEAAAERWERMRWVFTHGGGRATMEHRDDQGGQQLHPYSHFEGFEQQWSGSYERAI
ncbi:MAG: hypothetical protein L6R39_002048 [Caloplaca ligustica]|nr:MAG: hypothetical protein L6R39_002048 [Caloplaca ligustica]